MGLEWLNSVTALLIDAGFRTEQGYPAAKAMGLNGTVAAVNLTGQDSFTAKITVTILTPRSEGLSQCQAGAVEALEALLTDGGQWSFSGWQYDNGIDCYRIEIHGVRSMVRAEGTSVGGYQVLIGEHPQEYVSDFLARQQRDRRLIRPHGQKEPVNATPGMGGWTIKLTQMLPPEQTEPAAPEEPFCLTVNRGGHSQVFTGCYWSDYSSRQLADGTEVVRSGFALSREVD